MKVWIDNRLDREETIPNKKLVKDFLESKFADYEWPLERSLRAFLLDVGTYDNEGPDGFFQLLDETLPEWKRYMTERKAR